MADSLGFILSDISRLMRRRFDDSARAIGVTRNQWRTLFVVSRNEGINQGGLAELLEVEPISACRMVDRLQEAGLIERRADPQDRRAWNLYLTNDSRPLLDKLRGLGDALGVSALEGFSDAERGAIEEMLGRIRDNLSARPAEPTGAFAHGRS